MEQTATQTDQSRSIATLTNELLEDLTNPSMSAFEMCQIHQLTLIELIDHPYPCTPPPPCAANRPLLLSRLEHIMIQRVIRYKDNQSLAGLVINAGVLAYIVYITIQSGSSNARFLLLAVYAFLFLIPLAFSTFLSNHVQGTVGLMKYSQYVVYAYIAVLITNVFVIPFYVFLVMILFIIFSMGVAFWFYSHPTIMTPKTYSLEMDRQEVREEKSLRKEIRSNQRELNRDSHE